MNQNRINHYGFVIDSSASMRPLKERVVEVFDKLIVEIARDSEKMNQETRATIFTFDSNIECLFYDRDVLRLPSLTGAYNPNRNTRLIDATLQVIGALQKTPEDYGDHAFVIFVVTDGQENESNYTSRHLQEKIGSLAGNWSLACFVPDRSGKREAEAFGFPSANVQIWDSRTAVGLKTIARQMQQTSENFMRAREKGVRGSRNLFTLDATKLNNDYVEMHLGEVAPRNYRALQVRSSDDGKAIKGFVEALTGSHYRARSAYYELTKPEIVRRDVEFCVMRKQDGKVYGGAEARRMLGLPDGELRVVPLAHPDFAIFVQSQSYNRKLVGNTTLVVFN